MCDFGEELICDKEDEWIQRAKRERRETSEEISPYQQFIFNDSDSLLSLLPEELWIMIFEGVHDAEVLGNCAKASSFFYELLKPRRVEYLLPDILPVLIFWCKSNEEGSQSFRRSEVDISSSYISPSISSDDDFGDDHYDSDEETFITQKLDLRTLRLVCRCWNNVVVKYLLNHHNNFQIDDVEIKDLKFKEHHDNDSSDNDSSSSSGYFTKRKPEDHLVLFKADDVLKMEEFMETFEKYSPSRNPLFHRNLLIEDPSRRNASKEQVRLFWESVTPFLQKYGEYIWFCEIRIRNNITGYSYYFIVREWLQLMPNLVVLNWTYPIKWENLKDSEGHEFGSRIPIFLKCKLEDKVRENPLSKLKHLQVFKTDDLPYPIFREFIKRNDHISKLQFYRKFPPPPQYQEFYEYDFANGLRNITELSMILWRIEEIQELEISSTNSSWPLLQKLRMYWGEFSTNYDGYYVWSQVFNFVSKKCSKGALTDLTLGLPNAELQPLSMSKDDNNVFKIPTSLMLDTPQLRVLKMVLPCEHVNLDFVLSLKDSLEELQVGLKCEDNRPLESNACRSKHNPIIKFDGFNSHFLESNIWSMFPKLKIAVLKMNYNSTKGYMVTRRFYREDALTLTNTEKV